MAKTIFIVLVLLALVAYAAMFVTWNQGTVSLTGWAFGGQYWIEDNLPLGLVALGSVALGVLLAAVFLGGGYYSQRAAASRAQATVQRAKAKLNEFKTMLMRQRERIQELEAQLESTRAMRQLAEQAASAAATQPEPEVEVTLEEEPAEDDELI
ncbi:MAG: DUF1049 domain-containing protein [candidate division WS1 bacterium]|nr:DUF1049 domain-containing protein [candidate division WS1 bacterium]